MAMPHTHRASSSVPSLYLPSYAVIWTTDITLTIQPHAHRMLMRRRTLTHRRGADHGDEEAIRAAAPAGSTNGISSVFVCMEEVFIFIGPFPISFLVTSDFNRSILSSGLAVSLGTSERDLDKCNLSEF